MYRQGRAAWHCRVLRRVTAERPGRPEVRLATSMNPPHRSPLPASCPPGTIAALRRGIAKGRGCRHRPCRVQYTTDANEIIVQPERAATASHDRANSARIFRAPVFRSAAPITRIRFEYTFWEPPARNTRVFFECSFLTLRSNYANTF